MDPLKMYGGLDAAGSRVQHVGDPAYDDDAATKGWTGLLLDAFAPIPHVGAVASASNVVIDVNAYDAFNITALAVATLVSATGAPEDHQKLMVRILDNGTPQTVTWDPVWFRSSGVASLLTTTVPGKIHHVGLVFDAAVSVFFCLAVDATGA